MHYIGGMSKSSPKQKIINLALQGGGAHGAFTWGVLDKLLEDGRVDFEGICGTSAGTMNACALAYGLHKGGREKAREVLHDFWWNINQYGGSSYSPFKNNPWEKFMLSPNYFGADNFAYQWMDGFTRMFSPYQTNPFDFNPLRDVLEKTIDFEELRKCSRVKLFISATHVRTGKLRIFNTEELSIDVALASACLPFLFKAVDIDGEAYWDGGYVGNPGIYPLFYDTNTRDVMIVHINPLDRRETPTTAPEIMNRVNEISFNSSLIKEMRAIAFVKKLVETDMLKDEYKHRFKDVLVHSIRADKEMQKLNVASKFDSDWTFLTDLKELGRKTMDKWLKKNFDKINVEDTVDLDGEFLYSVEKFFEERSVPTKHKP